ncbi:hypothetical protein AM1_B0398 (plasmid) [Acaryochloris marina MBIC11017]|uniref:Uncharacterized protein n=1 Tax=Acaryochloris marina (strain MBIC 11017) TaxID=329726 RepID=A8ZLT9_ACAM1|nr:hypothetical protein AM1_B0398 [Acaryochloris marina MBIC11017]
MWSHLDRSLGLFSLIAALTLVIVEPLTSGDWQSKPKSNSASDKIILSQKPASSLSEHLLR